MKTLLLVGLLVGWSNAAFLTPGVPVQVTSSAFPGNSGYQEHIVLTAPAGCYVNAQCQFQVVSAIAPPGQCYDSLLSFGDGYNQIDTCGVKNDFTHNTQTNQLTITLTPGRPRAASFRCTVTAMNGGGPAPGGGAPGGGAPGGGSSGGRSPFFSKESRSVDSREHGLGGKRGVSCSCGLANKARTRIVGGKGANPNEFPFIAGILDTQTNTQFCGGTVVHEHYVVTAAHCTDAFLTNGRSMSAIAGAHTLPSDTSSPNAQVRRVARILQHTGYNQQSMENDISLLLMDRPFQFNKFVVPACLSPVQFNLEKQYIKIVGWGKEHHDAPNTSPTLKKLNIRVVPLAMCNRVYPHVPAGARRQICTHSSNYRGACMGDSGGPVVFLEPETNRYHLVGAVSFGKICGDRNDPSVHTDVSSYYSWIMQQMNSQKPGSKACTKV